jgi:hypothetical protein
VSDRPAPLRAVARFLTFRLSRADYLALDRRHLGFALSCTWIVGIGRWWDDPKAGLLQHSGLGSVVYACVLAAVLWLIVLPLEPRDWTYARVLTLVAMTAPPGILYAIPVERFLSLRTAGELNLWFLAAVAAWRVALLIHFLIRFPLIGWVQASLCALLPITAIVTALSALNLHRVVFNIMGSIGEGNPSAHDDAYGVLIALTVLSWLVFPLTASGYLTVVALARRRAKEAPEKT